MRSMSLLAWLDLTTVQKRSKEADATKRSGAICEFLYEGSRELRRSEAIRRRFHMMWCGSATCLFFMIQGDQTSENGHSTPLWGTMDTFSPCLEPRTKSEMKPRVSGARIELFVAWRELQSSGAMRRIIKSVARPKARRILFMYATKEA